MKKYWVLILAVCAMWLMSCQREKTHDYIPLSEAEKQVVPYRLGDMARFKDGHGNPVTLQVASMEDGWIVRDENSAYNEHLIYLGCRAIKLRSQDSSSCLTMAMSKDYYLSNNTSIKLYTRDVYVHNGEVPFYIVSFVTFDIGEWHDSVSIGGRMYYDVVDAIYSDNQCYYNKTEGVLQLKEKGKVLLERLP